MKPKKFIYGLIFTSFALFSCQDDEKGTPSPTDQQKGLLTLQLNVPSTQEPGTYALDAVDECEIQTIDVLVFNNVDQKYLYHVAGTEITTNATDPKIKTFKVQIDQTGPDKVYLMLIANANQQVVAAKTAGDIATTKTKDEICRSLIFNTSFNPQIVTEVAVPVGMWPVKPGAFVRFPMWGLSSVVDLNLSTITIPQINLIRAVAKIDVGLNFPEGSDVAAGLGKVFKLESVYLYNAPNQLYIAPDPNNISGTTVNAPSVPSTATSNANIQYALRLYNTNKIDEINEIYMAEHAAGSQTDRLNNACLVIAGRFGTTATEGSLITYYRIDFIKTTRNGSDEITAQEFLPLLRNHRYKVNITNVQNRGYDTADQAYKAMGLNTNLTVEITDTDQSITDFIYDGQYSLGVSKSSYTVDKTAHPNMELTVSTTYEQGWKATTSDTWITFTAPSTQAAAGKSILKFNVAANAGVQRTGTITLQSGRLFKTISIVQQNITYLEVVGKKSQYLMDKSKTYSFTVKSAYDWQVKVTDPENILKTFTSSGAANVAGSTFNFTLENDIVYETIIDATATLTFYSLTDEFTPLDVPIRGLQAFDLGNLYVYRQDQPTVQTWYVFANTPDNYNNIVVPPLGTQETPARPNSCASIRSIVASKPWRLPTTAEFTSIRNSINALAAVNAAESSIYYGFGALNYWTASPYTSSVSYAYYFPYNTGSTSFDTKATSFYARCVRSK